MVPNMTATPQKKLAKIIKSFLYRDLRIIALKKNRLRLLVDLVIFFVSSFMGTVQKSSQRLGSDEVYPLRLLHGCRVMAKRGEWFRCRLESSVESVFPVRGHGETSRGPSYWLEVLAADGAASDENVDRSILPERGRR
jgi:hypothetical protein